MWLISATEFTGVYKRKESTVVINNINIMTVEMLQSKLMITFLLSGKGEVSSVYSVMDIKNKNTWTDLTWLPNKVLLNLHSKTLE